MDQEIKENITNNRNILSKLCNIITELENHIIRKCHINNPVPVEGYKAETGQEAEFNRHAEEARDSIKEAKRILEKIIKSTQGIKEE